MMNRVSWVAAVLGALGLAACAAEGGQGPESPVEPTGSALEATNADLARLRALDVFEVGQLVTSLPAEATACYGLPCAGWEERVEAEAARQLPRLDRLTEAAERLAGEGAPGAASGYPQDPAALAADLATLRGLEIIGVGELVVSVPRQNPICYNLPCSEDIARADAENAARAAVVAGLAAAARTSGY